MSHHRVISRSTSLIASLAVLGVLLAPVMSPLDAAAHAEPPGPQADPGCIADGGGYLKVSLSGAHEFQIDWPNDGTVCHGAATRYGVGVNFGRTVAARTTLAVGFTIHGLAEGETGEGLVVELSIGGNAVGDDMFRSPQGACTVDITEHELLQETPGTRLYRVSGRGRCEDPASGMMGGGEIVVSEFEFSGTTEWSG